LWVGRGAWVESERINDRERKKERKKEREKERKEPKGVCGLKGGGRVTDVE
jgi:hypothetical protein